jgi:uncharacterized protein with von Willebrand factor type A (vWA) domain
MGEKFTPHFEGQEGFITPEKPEPEKSPSEQPKARDFLYDPKKQEILVFSKTKSGETRETRHPFQGFLYALREEEIKASTSEWIDLQKALAEGEIQSVDDLYLISRAVLVKDVTGYPKFDTVFGRMFYGVEPPTQETEEEQDEYEAGPEETEEEQQEEREEAEEENQSQEIVEPGFTEEHHGGEDVHKAIEDSQSSGHEGGGEPQQKSEKSGEGQKKEQEGKGQKLEQGEGGGKEKKEGEGGEGKEEKETGGGKRKEKKKKQGIIKEGKGGYSARERVVERRYDQYDKDQILNYEQFGRVLSKLTAIIQEASEVPTGKLDAQATVKSIAEHAGIPELVWREETEKKPKVILMFDVGGSTDEFRPIMEKLFAAAKDYLDDVEVYYFHNAIYGDVWPQKDGNYGKHFIPLQDILKKKQDSRVIIVGDAWMAENELDINSFEQLRRTFDHAVWINPIREADHDEWDNSGTIAEIKKVFSMHDMTLRGLENAVRELMEE